MTGRLLHKDTLRPRQIEAENTKIRFNNLQLYAQYARDQFRTRLTGTVSRDTETEEFSGTGSGEVRLGNDISNMLIQGTLAIPLW